ncbi:MAG: cytochrome c [Sulfitobacter sp.]
MKSTIVIGAIIVIAGLGYAIWPDTNPAVQTTADGGQAGGVLADVTLPDVLSQNAQVGERAYEAKCSVCHGANAAGQDGVAPPLIHVIYEPGHHGDESFQLAAATGVRAHHWPFGNMPPVDGITRGDVTMIVAYIRELQRANGIN